MIEYISFLLATGSAYWLYSEKPWKDGLGSKFMAFLAVGLVFSPLIGQTAVAWGDLIWKPIMIGIIAGFIYKFTGNIVKRFGLHSTKSLDEYRSGVRLVAVEELNALIAKIKGVAGPMLGAVKTKLEFFSTHLNLIGSTGSGKSLLLRGIIEYIRKNKQKAIILDPGAEFLQYFYNPETDVILNPRDLRSEDWSLFAEMQSETDAIRLTKSLIPEGKGSGKQWNAYAQTVLSETIKQIYNGKSHWKDAKGGIHHDVWEGTNEELFQRLVIDDNGLSASRMAGTGAGKLMAGAGEMVSSFMAIVGQHINPFSVLNKKSGKDAFSIRKWIENEEKTGILWITYNFDDLEFVRPIITMWVDIASTSILSLPTKRDRAPIWFIADEFPVLGPVNSVELLLTNGRKKGAHVVLASQTFSQWVDTYTENKAITFLGNMKTWCIFASPELKTREYLSNSIGKQEVDTKTYSGGSGKGASWSKNTTERQVVTASQIKTLEPRHFYVSLPGDLPLTQSIAPLPPETYVKVCEPFILKDEQLDDVIDISHLKEKVEHVDYPPHEMLSAKKPTVDLEEADYPFDINEYIEMQQKYDVRELFEVIYDEPQESPDSKSKDIDSANLNQIEL